MLNEHERSGFPEAIISALDQLEIPLTQREQEWLREMTEYYHPDEVESNREVRETCRRLVSECVRPFSLISNEATYFGAQRIVEAQDYNRAIISAIYYDDQGGIRGDVVHVKGIGDGLVIGNNQKYDLVRFNSCLRYTRRLLGVNSWVIFRDPPFPGNTSK